MSVSNQTRNHENDLDTCDLEPIHTPGTIQPFGALLAGPADLSEVTYCSVNAPEFFGSSPHDILGSSFLSATNQDLEHDLRNMVGLSSVRTQRQRLGFYDLKMGRFEIYLYVNQDEIAVVEFEQANAAQFIDGQSAIDRMRGLLAAVVGSETIEEMLENSVAGLRSLTGYDRVMAYRYAPNGDGEVVAESREPHVDSFLGLHYPAWDVPKQARALQIKNPLRMLTNISQVPIPILAHEGGAKPLDMAMAHLRGISPIHVEYLTNMGVGATLSLGLVVDGKLWGMFAFHHLSPKVVSSDVRIAVELFGQMASLAIKQRLDLINTLRRHKAARSRELILATTNSSDDFFISFPELAPIFSDVIQCDGLSITHEGQTLTYGHTPSTQMIEALAAHQPEKEELILPLTNLSNSGLLPDDDPSAVAGMLVIRATAALPIQLCYFKDEKIRNINWAGKPDKEMEVGPDGPRISPRLSFQRYIEEQRGFSDNWEEADLEAARELQITLTQITAKGERARLMRHSDLVNHKRQQDLMIAELNHRVKNILALIRSLSRQSKSSADSLENYAMALEHRISALASAHDLAVSNTMNGVPLRNILETELAPYLRADVNQILITGPDVGLRADVAPMIALVLHEIVSNAAKYGALSSDDGIVRMRWELGDDDLKFSWQEIGGPTVKPPERQGFGRSLIEQAIPYELDGHVALVFDPSGVTFDFELPADVCVDVTSYPPAEQPRPSVRNVPKAAVGKSALLVEDSLVLALEVAQSLRKNGVVNVETASSYGAALQAVDDLEFDFAVLDMNLRGTVSFAIAENLVSKGVPFLFVTGFGSSIELPESLRDIPILTKPIDDASLSNSIKEILQ